MDQVQRRAASQRELITVGRVDVVQEARQPEDRLQRLGAKTGVGRDPREIAAIREDAHEVRPAAGARCSGIRTFQRRASLPPRRPDSK